MGTRSWRLQSARSRTLAGLVLALPLAALIAGIFACLPVPVGDPETSKVDPALVGGWMLTDGKTSTLYIIRGYDPRTYLIQSLDFETNDDKSIKPGKHMAMKAWLTAIGDKRFITVEPFSTKETLGTEPADKSEKFYIVAAVAAKADQLELRVINEKSDLVKDVKTSADAEKVIKANIDDPKLYQEKATVLKKITKEQAETAAAILTAFNMD